MARKKKPVNENPSEADIRLDLESVSNVASRSEKTSWNRKMNNMVKFLSLLKPIEDSILELSAQKEPIFDEIQILREAMIKECTHPYEYLLHQEDHIICKFCNKKLGIPKREKKNKKGKNL